MSFEELKNKKYLDEATIAFNCVPSLKVWKNTMRLHSRDTKAKFDFTVDEFKRLAAFHGVSLPDKLDYGVFYDAWKQIEPNTVYDGFLAVESDSTIILLNNKIEIYKPKKIIGSEDYSPCTINWTCCGPVDIAAAEEFKKGITLAVWIANMINNDWFGD